LPIPPENPQNAIEAVQAASVAPHALRRMAV
jgi:hypothetical protein